MASTRRAQTTSRARVARLPLVWAQAREVRLEPPPSMKSGRLPSTAVRRPSGAHADQSLYPGVPYRRLRHRNSRPPRRPVPLSLQPCLLVHQSVRTLRRMVIRCLTLYSIQKRLPHSPNHAKSALQPRRVGRVGSKAHRPHRTS